MTAQRAATELGISLAAVAGLERDGVLDPVDLGDGGEPLYLAVDVYALTVTRDEQGRTIAVSRYIPAGSELARQWREVLARLKATAPLA